MNKDNYELEKTELGTSDFDDIDFDIEEQNTDYTAGIGEAGGIEYAESDNIEYSEPINEYTDEIEQEQTQLSKKDLKRLEREAKAARNAEKKQKQPKEKPVKVSKISKETQEYSNNTAQNSENIVESEMVLYVITDKPIPGLLEYMRSFGLNVTAVFSQVDLARGYLLMQSLPTRVVIVDSGTGKFMTTTIRKELIDMIGVNGEDSKFTVFYSDSALKSDANSSLGKVAKSVEWIKYSNTAVMVASLLLHHEKYILDESTAMSESTVDDSILAYVGAKVECESDDKIGVPIINSDLILKNVVQSNDDGLRGFEPHL